MNQIYDTYTQDPDETFRMYVERLMKAKPKFGGTFVNPSQGQGQQGQSQGQDSTAKATGGLLTGLFPEYADKMGGGGAGGESGGGTPYGGSVSDIGPSIGSLGSSTGRGNFASADTVMGLNSLADSLQGSSRGFAQAGNAFFGPIGMLAGLAPNVASFAADKGWGSFNQGIDSDAQALAEAQSLGGLGTFSDSWGNLGTVSNQSMVDAYDRDTFGITGSALASQSGWGGSGGGGGFTDAGGGVVGGDQGGYDGDW